MTTSAEPARSGTEQGKYIGIQCLRGIAAYLVVWTHIKFTLPGSTNAFVNSSFGAVGVDVFFVISGFVIALTASRNGSDWKGFLTNRIARVVAFYWLLSLPFLAYQMAYGLPSANVLVNSFLFVPFLDTGTITNPLHPMGWSLCFEVYFYLAFSASMAFFGRHSKLALLGFFAIGVAATSMLPPSELLLPRFMFSPLTLEFCAGIAIYEFRNVFGPKTLAISAIAVIGLGYAVYLTPELAYHEKILSDTHMGLRRALLWGGFGASLTIASLGLERIRGFSWPAILAKAGDVSYSVYLIQGLAIFPAIDWHFGWWPGWAKVGFFLVVSCVGSVYLYRLVELPTVRWAKKLLVGDKR